MKFKFTNKITLSALTAALILIAIPTFAKPVKAAKAHASGLQAKLARLNLTPAQRTAIQTDFQTFKSQAKSIKQSTETKDQKKAELKNLRKQLKTEVMNVLTSEQKQQLKASKKINPRLSYLSLTDAQKGQALSIKQDTKAKVKAIKQNSSLGAEQKAAQIKTARKDGKQAFLNILTPEQRAKFQQMKKDRKAQAASRKFRSPSQTAVGAK